MLKTERDLDNTSLLLPLVQPGTRHALAVGPGLRFRFGSGGLGESAPTATREARHQQTARGWVSGMAAVRNVQSDAGPSIDAVVASVAVERSAGFLRVRAVLE